MRLLLAIIFSTSACADNTPTGGCGENAGCPAGNVCAAGTCQRLCFADSDCAATEVCLGDVCSPGQRANAPVIQAIDGDGAVDPGAGDPRGTSTAHRLHRLITVRGAYLDGADLTMLADAARDVELALAPVTAEELRAELPDGIAEGHYVIRVSNAAGSDQAEVWLLRGEPGEQGPEGTPRTASEVLQLLTSLGNPVPGLNAASALVATTAATADNATNATTASRALTLADGSADVTAAALRTPAGALMYFATTACPSGWVAADGAVVSRGAYPALFDAIGTTYGAGDGNTTFGLPNLQGEFLRGAGGGRSAGNVQGQDFKSFSMQNTGGPTSSYSHGPVYFPKSGMSNSSLFGGYWSSPTGHMDIQWDDSEVRPRNVAMTICLKL
jgi:hypothetical protein